MTKMLILVIKGKGPTACLRIPDSYDEKIAKICKSASSSANKPSFQNPTKSLFAECSIDVMSLHFLHLYVQILNSK